MSERRRDRKGRLLKDGEFQEPSGRYRYSYMTGGERKVIYSWRLVVTDPSLFPTVRAVRLAFE